MKNPLIPDTELNEPNSDFEYETPDSIGGRIKILRLKAGLTHQQLADLLGISQTNIGRWEKNKMSPRQAMVGKLATVLNTNVNWLINGGEDAAPKKVVVVGFVGAGAKLYPIDDYLQGAGAEFIEPPFDVPSGVVAVTVRGKSMYPELNNGDILLYKREADFIEEDCLNKRCIIQTEDNEILVKRIKRSRKKECFNLESINADTLENIKIVWAAPVIAVIYQ